MKLDLCPLPAPSTSLYSQSEEDTEDEYDLIALNMEMKCSREAEVSRILEISVMIYSSSVEEALPAL